MKTLPIIITPIREIRKKNTNKNILIIKKRYNFNSLLCNKKKKKKEKKIQQLTSITTIAIIRTAI